jgi:hydroxypyruvate reductase
MTVAAAMLHEMARGIFRQSLADCSVEQAFARKVSVASGEDGHRRLVIHGVEAVDLDRVKRIRIVAAGKAATAMLEAVLPHLSSPECDLAGILIARELPLNLPPNFQFFLGGHPLPNEASCAGARAALEMLRAVQEDTANAAKTLCLFLISGGASAMMELPLDPEISLTDLVGFHRELVHCGASIAEINCVRKHFSAVKGGRLAMAARDAANLSLLVSDVPPGHLDTLASGPTLPDASTVHQCREILDRYSLLERFPLSVRHYFSRHDLPETPKAGELTAKAATLLASDDLAESARMRAEKLGFHVVIDNTCDDWDYRAAAEYLVNRLRGLRDQHSRVCLISSGEVTVKLPSMHVDGDDVRKNASGAGGRNQHFCLYAASLLDRSDASTVILSAGSDGIDGNSPAAGAVVDEQTLQGAGMRRDAERALENFDSYPFLQGIGATIVTGATGNNLRDLRMLFAEGAAK